MNVMAGAEGTIKIPIDVIIQPRKPQPGGLPILIEAKSAGDFTNTNKRRKEEATKVRQLTGCGNTASKTWNCWGYDATGPSSNRIYAPG
jgi:hypothetical protein